MLSKREFWFRHVEAWRRGNLAQIEYARKHNLSVKSFGYYRRRYFREQEGFSTDAGTPKLLSVSVIPEVPAQTDAESQAVSAGITLTSPGGFRIELSTGFHPRTLQQVLKLLEAA